MSKAIILLCMWVMFLCLSLCVETEGVWASDRFQNMRVEHAVFHDTSISLHVFLLAPAQDSDPKKCPADGRKKSKGEKKEQNKRLKSSEKNLGVGPRPKEKINESVVE